VLLKLLTVAPCAGAWIETRLILRAPADHAVAPCAGAWIETRHRMPCLQPTSCRPLRGGVD